MSSPHPYAQAADLLGEANKRIALTNRAHSAAALGEGSDTETAAHARATIRALKRYLDETSQPHTDPEEEQTETALERAKAQVEQAERDHKKAKERAASAYHQQDLAHMNAARAETAALNAGNEERNARNILEAARANLARHTPTGGSAK